jgi:hypothetical protein
MYTSKVSSSLSIDRKTGEAKMSSFEVKVDGYSDTAATKRAIESFNSGKDLKKSSYPTGCPKGSWCDLYYSMWFRMLKWKKKAYKKD